MNKVTCIDVSYWNGDVDFKRVKNSGIEAVIIRAGYGRSATQEDTLFQQNYKNAKAAGLKVGAYWYSYADSLNAASLEAKACLEVLDDKTFDMPVYYDLEESKASALGKRTLTSMANTFCEAIAKAGHKPGVYANLNWFRNYLDYDELKNKYSIWLAQYNVENYLNCDIWQNSCTGNIPGVDGNCDTNVIFNNAVFGDVKKSVEEIAKEVLAGKWGNGVARQTALTKAGYDYDEVQAEVNKMLGIGVKKTVEEIAKEVLAGKWGNGAARETALTKAGYKYDEIQAEVNKLLGIGVKKSIDEIAKEVIRGDWGNGNDRKERLTKAGYDYSAVQKRVTELLK